MKRVAALLLLLLLMPLNGCESIRYYLGIVALDAPPSPAVVAFGDNRNWVLLVPMRYKIGESSYAIVVPAGFVTDYASIPKRLWSLYPPHDQYSRAAVIHDYLYWSQRCTREQADKLFLIAMSESEVSTRDRYVVYGTVQLLGQSSWDENTLARNNGDMRILPSPYMEIVQQMPNLTWQEFKTSLKDENVKSEPIDDSGTYCHLGNATVVP